LFREFAFTLAGAVFISGVVALTLSPMMSSQLLRPPEQAGRLAKLIDAGFERIRSRYGRILTGTLKARRLVYAGWILLALAVIPMYMFSPKELAPNEDQGVVFSVLDVPPNASLEQIVPYTEQIEAAYEETPEFHHSFQITFPTGGFGGIVVDPWNERERNIFQIQPEIAGKLSKLAGVKAPAILPGALPSPGLFPIEFIISSTAEHAEIVQSAQQLAQAAMQSGLFAFPPIIDVRIDQQRSKIRLDRDRIAAMGLNMQGVGNDLSAMLSGNFVNRFNIEGRSYKVIPQIERASRLTVEQLEDIHIQGPNGDLIPLSAVARFERGVEPRTLNRYQQLNSVKISGVAPRSLDQGLTFLEDKAKEILPPGYRVGYTGESRQLREEGSKFLPAMGLAIVLIFLVLAAQFNSFRDPFVVLAGSVPLAMFGALIFTFLKFTGPPGLSYGLTEGWTTTLNIYSQVGLVTLVGLIAKNAILIVEFANQQQLAGLSKLEAVQSAAMTRLRPILMTTIATVAGHFPLTLVSGAGAVARNSIGIVLVGGMAIGTLFTLFVVPSVYVLVARDHSSDRARSKEADAMDPALQPSLSG
jgi:multidrug efflux pump